MTNGNSAPRKAGFRKAGLEKAVEGVQRVAHRALVRVQTRTDDEA